MISPELADLYNELMIELERIDTSKEALKASEARVEFLQTRIADVEYMLNN